MAITKSENEIIISGFTGYDPRIFRKYQTEAEFIKNTWPTYSCIHKPHENMDSIIIPRIFSEKNGPRKFHYKGTVPIRVTIRVEFGREEIYPRSGKLFVDRE